MKNSRFQTLTQTVGILTLVALAMLGLLSILGYSTPFAAAQDEAAVAIDGTERAVAASPSIPATFNYEGTLRDNAGVLINGARDIRAVIYDQATVGTALYVEDFPAVNVRDGQFNIVLGENPGSYNLLNAFNTAPLYIEIRVNSVVQLPRQRVHGVPWAINATNAFDGVPVGGVIDWWRPNSTFPLPEGFLQCNGQTVNDAKSPLNGFALPNFTDRVAVGVGSTASIGVLGGSSTHSHTTAYTGSHNHMWLDFEADKEMWTFDSNGGWWNFIDWGDGEDTAGSGGYSVKFGAPPAAGYQAYTQNGGEHNHAVTSASSYPPYVGVLKLCRIY